MWRPICSARYAPSAEPALLSCSPLATPRPCNSISTKSQPKLPQAHMPFSFSIKLDGTAPKTSRLPKTSRSCRCRRVRQSSTLKKIFGSSCGQTGCQTASSNPSTTSSTIAATPGTRSSTNPGKSCPSLAVIGQSPVTYCEDWYYALVRNVCIWLNAFAPSLKQNLISHPNGAKYKKKRANCFV